MLTHTLLRRRVYKRNLFIIFKMRKNTLLLLQLIFTEDIKKKKKN